MLKLKKKNIIIILLIIIVIVGSFLFYKNWKNDIKRVIVGSWSTPGGTIYVFNKDNTGFMQVPLIDYEFTYKFKDGKLLIDFKDEKAFDPTYEYTLENGKIILKGEKGTFTFTRIEFDQNKIKKTSE